MAAGRGATIVVIDVGTSMTTETTVDTSHQRKAEIANNLLSTYLRQKLFLTPRDHIAVVLFGTQDTDNDMHRQHGGYEHVIVHTHWTPLSMSVVRRVECLFAEEREPAASSSDPFEALIVACDYVQNSSMASLKGVKEIVLVTDGGSDAVAISAARHEYSAIASSFQESALVPHVLWIMSDQLTVHQQETSAFFMKFCNAADGWYKTHDDFATWLKLPRLKAPLTQTTKTRVMLSFARELHIPVWVYLNVKEETLPPLKSESRIAPGAGVRMDRIYVRTDSTDDEEVPQDARTRAFLYGRDLVPVLPAEMTFLKYDGGEKNLKVLGSVPMASVPPTLSMDKTECVVAAMGDLVQALAQQDLALIARYVWRAGSAPRLVSLLPHRQRHCLYLNVLPYAEDIRALQLPYAHVELDVSVQSCRSLSDIPLAKSDVMGEFIDAMTISSTGDDEPYRSSTTFNPTLQKFYRCVIERSRGNDAALPSMHDLEEGVRLHPSLQERVTSHELLASLMTSFPTEQVAQEKKTKKHGGRADEEQKPYAKVDLTTLAVEGEKAPHKEQRVDDDNRIDTLTIGTMNPVHDFEKMIAIPDRTVKQKGVDLMATVIERYVNEGGPPFFPKCMECLRALRRCCLAEQEDVDGHMSARYNRLVQRIHDMAVETSELSSLWETLCEENLGPIASQHDALASDLSRSTSIKQEATEDATMRDAGPEDDLFSLIE